ncbi:unnamed protein product [Soboliphyme baturini]|uniref:GPS2_interact domain-containing protein n=1 Tax=Soboliphyme baturini TaxID=241478 RepID=A0A183IPZ9_9BILA|nr:unnamed protein product [Soboliphyme baturini]
MLQMEGIQLRRDADSIRRRPSLLSDFPSSRDAVFPHFSDDRNFGGPACAHFKYETGANHGVKNKNVAYAPRVENVSPTPDDPYWPKTTERDTILEKIKIVDHDILVIEAQLNKLQKKRKDLEASSEVKSPEEDQIAEPSRELSLFEKVYAENRVKASRFYDRILNLGPEFAVPQYVRPSDERRLQDVEKKHSVFRPLLIAHLKRRHRYLTIREKYLTEKYNQQRQTWLKKIERLEKNPKKVARDAKYREVFEKTFPELRTTRESVERRLRLESHLSSTSQPEVDVDTEKVQSIDLFRRLKLHMYFC